jgi:hypothetical protein
MVGLALCFGKFYENNSKVGGCTLAFVQKKSVASFHALRLVFGGLDWNRTSDTRIFNCSTRQTASIYAGCKRKSCYVRHIVLQPNHRISWHVFILSARKIMSSTDFLASAGAVKILLLFSAPAYTKKT